MYTSDVNVATLVGEVMSEITVFPRIEAEKYFNWYNDIINILYGEIIRDKISLYIPYTGKETAISGITVPKGINISLPDDIDKIYHVTASGKRRYITRTAYNNERIPIFENTYYTDGEKLYINSELDGQDEESHLVIYAIYKPKNVTAENASVTKVALPVEFHDIIVTRLRGEAYKLCNEDGIAAKWLNEHNTLMEDFKLWQHHRKPII